MLLFAFELRFRRNFCESIVVAFFLMTGSFIEESCKPSKSA